MKSLCTTNLIIILVIMLLALAIMTNGEEKEDADVTTTTPHGVITSLKNPNEKCSHCPVCEYETFNRRCLFSKWYNYLPTKKQVKECIEWSQEDLIGQDHILEEIDGNLQAKIANPSMPLAMHFCGDNGVGKTFLAQKISQAWSLRMAHSCDSEAKEMCQTGNALVEIRGSKYANTVSRGDVTLAVAQIWETIEAQLAMYPHALILVDDFAAMSKEMVQRLAPDLFSSHGATPGPGKYPLEKTIVIATSDLRGKKFQKKEFPSATDLATAVALEVENHFGRLVGKDLQSFFFYSLDDRDVEDLVEMRIQRMKCRIPALAGGVKITQAAMDHLVDTILEQTDRLERDGGRFVTQELNTLVENRILKRIKQEEEAFSKNNNGNKGVVILNSKKPVEYRVLITLKDEENIDRLKDEGVGKLSETSLAVHGSGLSIFMGKVGGGSEAKGEERGL